MQLKETGFVLNVNHYEECIRFYSEILELPVRLRKDHLVNFQFGDSYLLIEKAPSDSPVLQGPRNNLYVLRMNVEDVDQAVQWVKAKGVEVNRFSCDWGEIGRITDPDGNVVEFCNWK